MIKPKLTNIRRGRSKPYRARNGYQELAKFYVVVLVADQITGIIIRKLTLSTEDNRPYKIVKRFKDVVIYEEQMVFKPETLNIVLSISHELIKVLKTL